MVDINLKVTNARFVDPAEFGLDYPNLTPQQLYESNRALNQHLLLSDKPKKLTKAQVAAVVKTLKS